MQLKLLGNKKLMSLAFTNMTLWAFPVKVVLSIYSHRLKRRRVIKILYKLLPWSSFLALHFKPEARIKKRVIFLIDSCCSYSVQIILAGSTTYCCFQIMLFQYLQQNSVLWKIKLQIKLYKLGGEASMSSMWQGALLHSAIKVNIFTVPLSLNGHSSHAAVKGCSWWADAVKVASTRL